MTQDLQIGSIPVGEAHPVAIIAEAACEHLGNLDVAKRLADAAKESGADIIKYQLHLPDEMIPGSIKFWAGSMDEVLARLNLDIDAQKELMAYCAEIGIQYLCTPFSARAADLLDEAGTPAFKTGSGEMTNIPMLRHIARKGKPMIVSTGMASIAEIQATVDALKEERAQFMLTHCTSAYPPRYDQINLRFIPKLRELSGVMVGHSDHTPTMWTAQAALVCGARVIEKHFTLDKMLRGPDWHVSLEPPQFREMVDAIRATEAALGDEKTVYPEEEVVRDWAHHSVVTVADVPAGVALQAEHLGVKRPGRGVPARHLEEFYGRVAKRMIPANTLLRWEDVEASNAR